MKKTGWTLLSAIAFTLFFSSCEKVKGDGPVITENRAITNFTAVANTVSGQLYYKQDNAYKVEIQAQQNILDVIRTEVVNNELVIKFKDGVSVGNHEPIVINISSPNITGLRLSGSGSISAIGPITATNIFFKISGSGNMSIPMLQATGVLDADISGSGNIGVISGTAVSEVLKISGSGNINVQGVAVNTAQTNTSGSGEIRLSAVQTLNVKITGSGSVYYKGNPAVTTNISGSGSVIHVP